MHNKQICLPPRISHMAFRLFVCLSSPDVAQVVLKLGIFLTQLRALSYPAQSHFGFEIVCILCDSTACLIFIR